MSNAPYALPGGLASATRWAMTTLVDLMIWGRSASRRSTSSTWLQQAARVARELGISREEQDEWAFRSHERAAKAQDDGVLRGGDRSRWARWPPTRRPPRHHTRAARDARAPDRYGRIDYRRQRARCERWRSCLVISREALARGRGIEPLATILAQGYVADDFAPLARTPAGPARSRREGGRTIDDVARRDQRGVLLGRVNSVRLLGTDAERVNVNGGAVALGHPIGATGGRILGDACARAAAGRRRTWPRGDLLRRGAGRRDPDRGLSEGPSRWGRPALLRGMSRHSRSSSCSRRSPPAPVCRRRRAYPAPRAAQLTASAPSRPTAKRATYAAPSRGRHDLWDSEHSSGARRERHEHQIGLVDGVIPRPSGLNAPEPDEGLFARRQHATSSAIRQQLDHRHTSPSSTDTQHVSR